MSRTRKGTKGVGYEYWSRRFGYPLEPGPWSKKVTHRKERRQGKKEAHERKSDN